VNDTKKYTALEIKEDQELQSSSTESNISKNNLHFKEVFIQTSWRNHSLLAVSQAGLVNNLIFGISWGLFTLYFASFGTSVNEIGFLKALHPGIWGVLQLVTGSLSDRLGRKILIYPGMIVQASGIWIVLFANSFLGWVIGMSLLGVGTALVYPTLLAAISDIADPRWRATSLGIYRFWRDLGFVVGAVAIGFIADLSNISLAIHVVAWIALASGIFVLVIMKQTKKYC
jgi:MFS family permease